MVVQYNFHSYFCTYGNQGTPESFETQLYTCLNRKDLFHVTLQNLRYISEIAKHKSVSGAAKALFMSQSSLSGAVKELEEEMGIQIFIRTNRGVALTPDGEDFLTMAQDIIDRSDLLALKYQNKDTVKTGFSVTVQHLPFAARAFQDLLSDSFAEEYDVSIRETATNTVIYDVSTQKSELGVLAIPSRQLHQMMKAISSYNLAFTILAELHSYVFLRAQHPLASFSELSLDMLAPYPFVTYDQDEAPGYFTEEVLLFTPQKRNIHVCDRATKMLLLRNTDAFSIGIDLPNYIKDIYFQSSDTELTARPLKDFPEPVITGFLTLKEHPLSPLGQKYIENLSEKIGDLKYLSDKGGDA